MKIAEPKNVNYAAQIVRIPRLVPLEGLDNLLAARVLGAQALVSKDTEPGVLAVAFTAETQLSDKMASWNNLYRHSNLNWTTGAVGYLEDNRRIKAIKLRGHRSDALLLPLESLSWTQVDITQLKEGDTFDQLGGNDICNKYQLPGRREPGPGGQLKFKESRVEEKLFPQHWDTANYFRVGGLNPDKVTTVTQKLHGTSVRIGHVPVARKLSWLERVARRFGVKVQETEYDYVYGSRKVIKDANDPDDGGYYKTDLHTSVGSRLKGLLPRGTMVYGEIIGWLPGTQTAIQKNYTYRLPEGYAELYVYRIASINQDGNQVDWDWETIKDFCGQAGIKHVPELYSGLKVSDGRIPVESFLDTRFSETHPDALEVGPVGTKLVDEGVVLRQEGLYPVVRKAKSPIFLQHETKELDKGVVDTESAEG